MGTADGTAYFTHLILLKDVYTLTDYYDSAAYGRQSETYILRSDGTRMYDLNLKGAIGLVIGNEGEGVSRLVKEKCDMTAAIPMKGDIDSLNASVAAGVLAYEIVRQRG